MLTASFVILAVMVSLSAATLIAFSWSASHGQFDHPDDAARSIFDASEPVGSPTDPEIRKHRRS